MNVIAACHKNMFDDVSCFERSSRLIATNVTISYQLQSVCRASLAVKNRKYQTYRSDPISLSAVSPGLKSVPCSRWRSNNYKLLPHSWCERSPWLDGKRIPLKKSAFVKKIKKFDTNMPMSDTCIDIQWRTYVESWDGQMHLPGVLSKQMSSSIFFLFPKELGVSGSQKKRSLLSTSHSPPVQASACLEMWRSNPSYSPV